MDPFRRLKRRYPYLHAIVIGIALIMMWRGIWGLMDNYLFPDNLPLSYSASLILGLFLLLLDDLRIDRFK